MADMTPGRPTNPLQTPPQGTTYLDYPYTASENGTPGTTTADDHLRDLILQVLFTNPGERINLPQFGVGILRFVFEPNNDALRATLQFLISSNLERWLSDRITVDTVVVSSEPGYEEPITIDIGYTVLTTQQSQSIQVQI